MVLSPRTKKLAVAGGIAAGVLALGAIVFWPKKVSAAPAPLATDSDISKVVDAALVKETDPAVLRQLATAMMVLPYSNPLHNKIGLLQARATELELGHQVVQGDGGATAHVRQF